MLHVVAGVLFALSVPVGVILIALAHLGGSCSGITTAQEIQDARWVMIEVGLIWSLLPFTTAVVARLLHSRWIPWAVLGCLPLAWAVSQAATTTKLSALFCF